MILPCEINWNQKSVALLFLIGLSCRAKNSCSCIGVGYVGFLVAEPYLKERAMANPWWTLWFRVADWELFQPCETRNSEAFWEYTGVSTLWELKGNEVNHTAPFIRLALRCPCMPPHCLAWPWPHVFQGLHPSPSRNLTPSPRFTGVTAPTYPEPFGYLADWLMYHVYTMGCIMCFSMRCFAAWNSFLPGAAGTASWLRWLQSCEFGLGGSFCF